MASFTGVGDSVSLSLTHKGDVASVALSGTYDMTIALQREQGSKGSGAWETLKTWNTADATVAYDWTAQHEDEELRLIVLVDTSGTCTATLLDNTDLVLNTVSDSVGNVIQRNYQDGPVFYNSAGEVVADLRQDQKFIELGDADATLSAANSGKTHIVNNVSADRTFTLPAAAKGLSFKLVAEVGAADGHDWIIVANATTHLFRGGLFTIDADASPVVADVVVPDQSDDDQLQVNLPEGGTWVQFDCVDGTTWTVHGIVISATAPAFS